MVDNKSNKAMKGGSACAAAKNNMKGGSACAAAKNNMKGGSACSARNNLKGGSACAAAKESNKGMTGGSLASSFVETYANAKSQNQPLDEYQTEMALPGLSNLKGGGCGCSNSWMKGGKKSKRRGHKKERKTKKGKGWQKAGGSAQNRVMNAVAEVKSGSADYEPAGKLEGVKSMPNLYQTTGGGSKKVMRGGSFWNLAGCGPANYPDAGRKYAHHFSKTSRCPGPEEIANPPNLGKAGSGDAAELSMGGTYPFA